MRLLALLIIERKRWDGKENDSTRKGVRDIEKGKIRKAVNETNKIYFELGLDYTEIEIVTRCQNIAARVAIEKERLETEAEKAIKEQQTPIKMKIIKWMPIICSTLAIVMSIISLALRLY